MTLWELIKQGGVALYPLGLCSVLIIAVVLERLFTYSRLGSASQEMLRRIEGMLAAGDWMGALRVLDTVSNPFARLVKASLMRKPSSQQETEDILAVACDAEIAHATRPLPVLGTIGNIAPFIGLLGTVIGIMKAFQEYRSGATGPDAVSGGIAEALIATAIGLGVGIVAVISNNWCNAWVEEYRLRLERFATEWAYRLHDLIGQGAVAEEAGKEPVA